MGFRVNYHTHTFRCRHASGDAVDYARVAAAGGCRTLGFSDHVPLPDGRWPSVRMTLEQLDDYERAVAAARAAYPELRVLIGLECEHLPEHEAFLRDELLGRRSYDYLVGASHYLEVDGAWRNGFEGVSTPAMLRAYADQCVRTMASGLFAFLAHPDIIGCSNPEWTADTAACARDICAAAAALGVPLELNSHGLRKAPIATAAGPRATYPWEPFWEVAAAHGATVVLNSDAHRPEDVLHGYEELAGIRDRFELREDCPRMWGYGNGGLLPTS